MPDIDETQRPPKVWPPVPTATDVVRLPRPVLWLLVAAVAAMCWIAWEVRASREERNEAERKRLVEVYGGGSQQKRDDQEPATHRGGR